MADSEAPPSSDRRRALRRVACFPSYVEHPGEDRATAIIADVAETGALLLMRRPEAKVGDEIRVELYVELDVKRPRNVTGRVVRVEALPDERTSLWTHQVAVEFAEPIALSAAEIESLEKRQAPFGKR
jgi:hypothetical protein